MVHGKRIIFLKKLVLYYIGSFIFEPKAIELSDSPDWEVLCPFGHYPARFFYQFFK